MKSKLFFLLNVLFSTFLFSQETKIIGTKDNVEISYQLTELDKNSKKDKYLITISFENKSDSDLYYALPLMKNSEGKEFLNPLLTRGFANVLIRNSTGLFRDGRQLIGQETILRTEDNGVLIGLEKNKIYNVEDEFTVKAGEKPIITNSYLNTLRKLDQFNIKMSDAFINGMWQSNCGNTNISLSIVNENGQEKLLQTVNGKQIKWLKQNSTTFAKENDTNSTLTYNKSNNKFFYSSSDGNNCEWTKK